MSTPYALEIRDLHKTYNDGVTALSGVDLRVNEGNFFALLGPNGAGKSTLIGIVSSLVTQTRGSVHIFGRDMDAEPAWTKLCIGLVPQEYNFNVWESPVDILINQAGYYGIRRQIAKSRARHYLQRLGLWDKHAGTSRNLSGGMKRRLMIARALVHEPRLLILDEPTAGVDIGVRRAMWEYLREINRAGTTIILTTHNLEEAESLCKHIAIIDRGLIIEDTQMKTLINKLTQETFILDLGRPLATLPAVTNYVLRQVDETTLEADISKDQGINGLFAQLSEQSIEVISLRNKTNRLEELFIRLVSTDEARAVDSAARSRSTTEPRP